MSKIILVRTNVAFPGESMLKAVSHFLFKCFDGVKKEDKRGWRMWWKRLFALEPGEWMVIEIILPRSGPFHRRHMAIEQAVFNLQDRFDNFDMFRVWLKVGAGWVIWAAGPKGGVIPIPKSISYAKADETAFRTFHDQMINFLRGDHAAPYLWPHLDHDGAHAMMHGCLEGFDE